MFKHMLVSKLALAIFLLSIVFTYSYIDFDSNMSVGSGHAYLAKSLALNQDFDLNESWGNAGIDIIKIDNNYYSAYAPMNAVLMAIPYFILQIIYYFYTNFIGTINGDISLILESLALSFVSSLALTGVLLLLKSYIKNNLNISAKYLNILILAAGLGTLLFSYSVSFFNHVISAFFILSAYYLLTTNKNKKYLLTGVLTGMAFLTEFPTILFCVAVFIGDLSLFITKKKHLKKVINDLSQFALPVAVSILIILFYNYYHFGNAFLFAETILREQKAANGITTHSFSQNIFYGIYGELFSPLKGLFVYSPFLIFALFGIRSFFKKHGYNATLAISYSLIIIFIYSLWDDCFGASVYGSRYLITIIPFLIISISYFYEKILSNNIVKHLYLALVTVSVIVTIANAWFGIARGKFSECEKYLNTMNPYVTVIENFSEWRSINPAPILIEYIKNKN